MYAKIAIQSDGTGALDSTEAFDKPGPGFVRWYGGTNADGLTWGDRPVNLGDLVLPLPAPAAGCQSKHDGLIHIFRRELGGGVPLDALSDEWEIIEDEAGRVVEVEITYCGDDGGSFRVDVISDVDDGVRACVVEAVDPCVFVALDDYDAEDDDEVVAATVYVAVSDDGEVIDTFEDEYDADEAVDRHRGENRYGYPWANGWAYYVEGRYLVDDLQAAGFTVAEQTETGHLFCGIDGGGYDFQSAHHVVFAALRLARYGGRVDTSAGPCIPVGPVR